MGPFESSSGREGEAETEEEGEEEEGSEPARQSAHSATRDNTLRREWQCAFWGRCVRSGHPEESDQTDSEI